MKYILLISILFFSLLVSAQKDSSSNRCEAAFKYEFNTKIMAPYPFTAVNFYDVSKGNVIAWFWEFGDGESSTEQNPLHIYERPVPAPNIRINPYREVSLTILTSDSCKSIFRDTINIMQGHEELNCKAAFKYHQVEYDSVSNSATVQFTNLSKGDSLNYSWQFGDMEIVNIEKDPLFKFNLNQTEYKVCLTVIGKDSCKDVFCDVVYLKNPNDTLVSQKCKTAFGYKINYDIHTFAPALVLDFYSKADPPAIEWHWDFGDGNTSNEENPTHIFNLPLNVDSVLGDPNPFRKVCLTVVTEKGCKTSYCEKINIFMNDSSYVEPSDKCRAYFKYHKADIPTIPEVVPYKFYDVSEGEIISRLWEFEDGTSDTSQIVQKNFDFFKETQKVCLTVINADSCINTYCDVIYVIPPAKDSVYVDKSKYHMRYESSFPVHMSSCAGKVKAQVYYGDSIVKADHYKWSHGVEGQEAKGFCPTQNYSVKAKTPEGIIVSGTFVFNSDGTVTEKPIHWWVTGKDENKVVQFRANSGYLVEIKLCDGTIVKADSVKLELINCNTENANLILKDSLGNVVYTDNISKKSVVTFANSISDIRELKLFPNPVRDVLNIQYSGNTIQEMQIEIFSITGNTVLVQEISNVEQGQNIGLNVHALKNGLYLCKITADKQLIGMKRFMK